MKVVYRPAAIEDISRISDYIANGLNNPRAAKEIVDRILKYVSYLEFYPLMGMKLAEKDDRVSPNIRYIIIKNYLAFYETAGDTVEIIRVIDGMTDYLSELLNE